MGVGAKGSRPGKLQDFGWDIRHQQWCED